MRIEFNIQGNLTTVLIKSTHFEDKTQKLFSLVWNNASKFEIEMSQYYISNFKITSLYEVRNIQVGSNITARTLSKPFGVTHFIWHLLHPFKNFNCQEFKFIIKFNMYLLHNSWSENSKFHT